MSSDARLQVMVYEATGSFEAAQFASEGVRRTLQEGSRMSGEELGRIIDSIVDCDHCSGLMAQMIAHSMEHRDA